MNAHRHAAYLVVSASLVAGCEVVAGIDTLTIAEGGAASTGTTSASSGTSSGSGTTTSGVSGAATGSPGTSGDEGGASSSGTAGPGTSSGAGDTSSSSSSGASDANGSSTTSSSSSSTSSTSSGGVEAGSYVLIDDMESDNGIVPSTTVPGGTWFEYNDGTAGAMQSPAPNAEGTLLPMAISPPVTHFVLSNYGMETYGTGFKSYGAGLGFNMDDLPGKTRQTIDASAYTGIVFFARLGSNETTPTTHVRFNVPAVDTDPMGMICTSCNDHYGAGLDKPPLPTLSTTSQEYVIPFSSLSQEGYGTPVTWDPHHIYGCQWQAPEDSNFDFWVDDVYFIAP